MLKPALDQTSDYSRFDTCHVYDTLTRQATQFESGWQASHFVSLDVDPSSINRIIFVGMGGSNLSAKILSSLSPLLLNCPFEIVSNYRLPVHTDQHTLVILSSYSGDTAETLSCGLDAQARHAPTIVITAGGRLQAMANEHHWPAILLDSSHNPTHLPRYGLMLSLGALFGIIGRLYPTTHLSQVKPLVTQIHRTTDLINRDIPQDRNPAKKLASQLRQQSLFILGANHLSGVGESATNYLHESSKSFSAYFPLPDAQHHLLDGLVFPPTLKQHSHFILLGSGIYPQAIQHQISLCRDVLVAQGYQVSLVKPESSEPVLQSLESLVFFLIFSYYLSIINHVDPATNPWINYLKTHI